LPKKTKEINKDKMTHVNNGEVMEKEMEPTGERERDRETAAGSGVHHRFLASASKRDANSGNALEAAATKTKTGTTITNLEDLAFEACQNWSDMHQDFFITDDELEYEDELSLGSSIGGNIATTTTADAAVEGLITGEHQNEQLLMEGAYAITVKSMNPVQCGAIAFLSNTVTGSLS